MVSRSLSKENLYAAAACLSLFLVGWDDGTLGPLLPRLQSSYRVNYITVSTIFISRCSGAFSAALVNMGLSDRYGFGKTVVLGVILQCVGFIIQSPAPPFPLLAISYFVSGFGSSLQDAQDNNILSVLPTNQHAKMMIGHGFYGLGAFAAPLVSTQFSQKKHFMLHYLVSLGLSVVNLIVLVLVYKFRREADLIKSLSTEDALTEKSEAERNAGTDQSGGHVKKYGELMRLRIIHIAAIFIFLYVGVEVTQGNWSVTFLEKKRGGGPSSGYVSSGFFGGITLGRFLLIWVNQAIGETRVIFLYSLICIAFQLTVWLVPSLWENAIAISFVGFFLGPIYPTVVLTLSKMVPPRYLNGAIGWISCCGATGAAVFPFILGAIAQGAGVWVLQPLMVAILSLMVIVWTVALVWSRSGEGEDSGEEEPSGVTALPDPGVGLVEADKPSPTRSQSLNSEKSPE